MWHVTHMIQYMTRCTNRKKPFSIWHVTYMKKYTTRHTYGNEPSLYTPTRRWMCIDVWRVMYFSINVICVMCHIFFHTYFLSDLEILISLSTDYCFICVKHGQWIIGTWATNYFHMCDMSVSLSTDFFPCDMAHGQWTIAICVTCGCLCLQIFSHVTWHMGNELFPYVWQVCVSVYRSYFFRQRQTTGEKETDAHTQTYRYIDV